MYLKISLFTFSLSALKHPLGMYSHVASYIMCREDPFKERKIKCLSSLKLFSSYQLFIANMCIGLKSFPIPKFFCNKCSFLNYFSSKLKYGQKMDIFAKGFFLEMGFPRKMSCSKMQAFKQQMLMIVFLLLFLSRIKWNLIGNIFKQDIHV